MRKRSEPKLLLTLAASLLDTTVATAAWAAATADASALIPAGAELERVAAVSTHAEGPALGPDGLIYFCDVTVTAQSGMEAGAIYAFDPRTRALRVVLAPSGMAGGIKFDAAGNMVTASGADYGSRAITRIDRATRRARFLATQYQGHRLNSPDDLTIDRKGRIYFTDPRYFGSEPVEQAVSGVYWIDTDGSLHLITATMTKPNGIVLSPDEKTLYVVNGDNGILDRARQEGAEILAGPMQVVAFDLNARGEPSHRRVLVDFGQMGSPDGLAVDTRGDIWVANSSKVTPEIDVYDPRGRRLARLVTPEPAYNLALVALPDGDWLYVTAGKSLYRVRVKQGLADHLRMQAPE